MANAISSPRPKQATFYGLTVDLLNLTSCETVDLCLVVVAAVEVCSLSCEWEATRLGAGSSVEETALGAASIRPPFSPLCSNSRHNCRALIALGPYASGSLSRHLPLRCLERCAARALSKQRSGFRPPRLPRWQLVLPLNSASRDWGSLDLILDVCAAWPKVASERPGLPAGATLGLGYRLQRLPTDYWSAGRTSLVLTCKGVTTSVTS